MLHAILSGFCHGGRMAVIWRWLGRSWAYIDGMMRQMWMLTVLVPHIGTMIDVGG